jgi:hypothetical protein
MSAIDIKRLFRTAWEQTKKSEEVTDDDPVVEHIEGNVIRTIAALDIAQLQREKRVSPADALPPDLPAAS